MKYILLAAALAAVLGFAGASIALPFYANDFEVDDSANWTINKGPATTDEAHDLFFDYSTVGVPLAPNSAPDASPRGLEDSGQSVEWRIRWRERVADRFELYWPDHQIDLRLVGQLQWSSPSRRQRLDTIVDVWRRNERNGVPVAWRHTGQHLVRRHPRRQFGQRLAGLLADAGTSYVDASPVYAAGAVAGNRNSSNAYYAGFGGLSAPAAQTLRVPAANRCYARWLFRL